LVGLLAKRQETETEPFPTAQCCSNPNWGNPANQARTRKCHPSFLPPSLTAKYQVRMLVVWLGKWGWMKWKLLLDIGLACAVPDSCSSLPLNM